MLKHFMFLPFLIKSSEYPTPVDMIGSPALSASNITIGPVSPELVRTNKSEALYHLITSKLFILPKSLILLSSPINFSK